MIRKAREASDFCSPIFCVPKPSNIPEHQLVVDSTGLNKKIQRPVHPKSSATSAWWGVPCNMKCFVTLDLSSFYWQIWVDEPLEGLLTFMVQANTSLRRYYWKHLPIGLNFSTDIFSRLVEEALMRQPGLTNFVKIIDDIRIYTETPDELIEQL